MDTNSETSVLQTPAKVVSDRKELRPLPLRVAEGQYHRLVEARNRTGISIQEHVRRAVDIYLNAIEREAMDLGLMPLRAGAQRRPPQKSAEAPSQADTRGAAPINPPARPAAPRVVRK